MDPDTAQNSSWRSAPANGGLPEHSSRRQAPKSASWPSKDRLSHAEISSLFARDRADDKGERSSRVFGLAQQYPIR